MEAAPTTMGPWVHDLDPIIGTVFGVHLWWYGLSYSLGFLNAHLSFMRRRAELGLSTRDGKGEFPLEVIDVSVPASLEPAPLDGRVILVISRRESPEPRMARMTSLNAQPMFGVTVDGLKPGQPVLELAKLVRPASYSYAGDTITYTLEIYNTGNVPLVGPLVINDPKLSNWYCPANPIMDMLPGVTVECSTVMYIPDSMVGSYFQDAPTANMTYNGAGVVSNEGSIIVSYLPPPTPWLNCSAPPLKKPSRDNCWMGPSRDTQNQTPSKIKNQKTRERSRACFSAMAISW